MLLYRVASKLYSLEDGIPIMIYDGKFGTPDRYKIFKLHSKYVIVMIIDRLFYIKDDHNKSEEWIIFDPRMTQDIVDFHIDSLYSPAELNILYSDSSLIELTLGNRVVYKYVLNIVIPTNGESIRSIDGTLSRAYDHDGMIFTFNDDPTVHSLRNIARKWEIFFS